MLFLDEVKVLLFQVLDAILYIFNLEIIDVSNRWTDGPTDGWTKPPMKMRERILSQSDSYQTVY